MKVKRCLHTDKSVGNLLPSTLAAPTSFKTFEIALPFVACLSGISKGLLRVLRASWVAIEAKRLKSESPKEEDGDEPKVELSDEERLEKLRRENQDWLSSVACGSGSGGSGGTC